MASKVSLEEPVNTVESLDEIALPQEKHILVKTIIYSGSNKEPLYITTDSTCCRVGGVMVRSAALKKCSKQKVDGSNPPGGIRTIELEWEVCG
ncbi:hypothetical protein BpHYR1_008029 [Brachionus plicatilis]|uniref:Uncharacterized protein n=1 Tax=Brachionus plicatilis TaxID=10195 RepID=A0A3M7T5Z5_BRAPC|nr:hypothetical protein BpHYR1_008029 [Brachionus plicatilis]